jgi:hypothetical protein
LAFAGSPQVAPPHGAILIFEKNKKNGNFVGETPQQGEFGIFQKFA